MVQVLAARMKHHTENCLLGENDEDEDVQGSTDHVIYLPMASRLQAGIAGAARSAHAQLAEPCSWRAGLAATWRALKMWIWLNRSIA